MTYEELEAQRFRDLQYTARGLKWATAIGLLFVSFRYIFLAIQGKWYLINWSVITGQVFIALLWAVAWFAAGFLLGFLFGIPKVSDSAKASAPGPGAGGGPSATGGAPKPSPYQLRVNTNLEEISDWLTKILVGATLTQLVKVPSKIGDAAKFMADGLGAPASTTFAASILVYFSCVGFFAGYVLTRMFFAGAFARSDLLSTPDIDTLKGARTTLDPSVPSDPDVQAAAEKTKEIKIDSSLSAALAAAVAAGALLTNDTPRAVQAAKIAVDKNPEDPRVHLNYAIALHRNNPKENERLVRQVLEKAVDIVNRKYNAAVTEDTYNSIIFFYLYVPPPDGFAQAIKYGEEYLKNQNVPSRSSIWTNLACAYGQQYADLKKKNAGPTELEAVKTKAFTAIRNSLQLNPQAAARFRELALATGPDPMDNDLASFAADPEFKKLVDLP